MIIKPDYRLFKIGKFIIIPEDELERLIKDEQTMLLVNNYKE